MTIYGNFSKLSIHFWGPSLKGAISKPYNTEACYKEVVVYNEQYYK